MLQNCSNWMCCVMVCYDMTSCERLSCGEYASTQCVVKRCVLTHVVTQCVVTRCVLTRVVTQCVVTRCIRTRIVTQYVVTRCVLTHVVTVQHFL